MLGFKRCSSVVNKSNKQRFLALKSPTTDFSNRCVGSFLVIEYNRLFSHGLWSGMRKNSTCKDSTFSSHLLTQPVACIQNTCCILWIKNYSKASSSWEIFLEPLHC